MAVLQDLAGSEEDDRDQPAHVLLLDQLFNFVGSNPEKAVRTNSLLCAGVHPPFNKHKINLNLVVKSIPKSKSNLVGRVQNYSVNCV